MRRRMGWAALLLAALALAGCVRMAQEGEEFQVYFLTKEEGLSLEQALVPEGRRLPEGTEPVEGLLSCLLEGPENEDLSSAFPPGVTVRSWTLEDGLLTVDFSGRYASLSGVSLTLADYSVVLTLTQLEGVDAVAITADGDPISYRDHPVMAAADLWTRESGEEETPAEGAPGSDGQGGSGP